MMSELLLITADQMWRLIFKNGNYVCAVLFTSYQYLIIVGDSV